MPKLRSIQTTYYDRKKVVKVNNSVHPNQAVLHSVNHMQMNNYGATACEVYDWASGVLHCVVKRRIDGHIEISYKRAVKPLY
jgi:hypothetical protein